MIKRTARIKGKKFNGKTVKPKKKGDKKGKGKGKGKGAKGDKKGKGKKDEKKTDQPRKHKLISPATAVRHPTTGKVTDTSKPAQSKESSSASSKSKSKKPASKKKKLTEEEEIAAELDKLDREIDSDKHEPELSPEKEAAKQAAATGEYSLLHPEFVPRKGSFGKRSGKKSLRRHKLIKAASIGSTADANEVLNPSDDRQRAQLKAALDQLVRPFDAILVEKAADADTSTDETEAEEEEEESEEEEDSEEAEAAAAASAASAEEDNAEGSDESADE